MQSALEAAKIWILQKQTIPTATTAGGVPGTIAAAGPGMPGAGNAECEAKCYQIMEKGAVEITKDALGNVVNKAGLDKSKIAASVDKKGVAGTAADLAAKAGASTKDVAKIANATTKEIVNGVAKTVLEKEGVSKKDVLGMLD
jgi:hypothetical protein